ncbi:hypothetical protein ACLMJK_000485 [Lecanora helva]
MSSASCYYPNGDESTGDIPCGDGDGVACCPKGWTCVANGLCHLADPFYYGRYTCTDKSWKAKGCPDICTHGNTAAGAEAVIECSSGSYCCDANRPDAQPDGTIDQSKDCCHTSNDRFPLAQLPLAPGGAEDSNDSGGSSDSGNSAAASSSSPSPAAASTVQVSPSSSTSTDSDTSTTSPQNNASPTSKAVASSRNNAKTSNRAGGGSTQVVTSIITQNSGGSSTLITTTSNAPDSLPASSTPSPSSSSSNSKNLGAIIGPAVAVPIAVLLLAALAFFLFRRRRRQKQPRASSPPPMRDNLQPMYGADGKDLVDSPYTGKSELEGSPNPNLAAAGSPKGDGDGYHTPNDVGVSGAKESKSELAASNSTAARSPRSRLSELQGSPSIGEKMEGQGQPAELQGNDTQDSGYKPYRPPGLGLSE